MLEEPCGTSRALQGNPSSQVRNTLELWVFDLLNWSHQEIFTRSSIEKAGTSTIVFTRSMALPLNFTDSSEWAFQALNLSLYHRTELLYYRMNSSMYPTPVLYIILWSRINMYTKRLHLSSRKTARCILPDIGCLTCLQSSSQMVFGTSLLSTLGMALLYASVSWANKTDRT